MTVAFWTTATLLAAAAVLFVLPPLWRRGAAEGEAADRARVNLAVYRDQLAELERDLEHGTLSREQYELARHELERRLLEEAGEAAGKGAGGTDAGSRARGGRGAEAPGRGLAWALGVALPAAAVGLYLYLGEPRALDPGRLRADAGGRGGVTMAQIEAMVEGLAQRLQEQPDDLEGWRMLGRSYAALGRLDRAARVYEQAVARFPADPDLLADYADVLAMLQGGSLEGRPLELLRRALALAPAHQKALWLMGTAAYDRKDYAEALGYWRRLEALLPPGSREARTMAANIAEVQRLMGAGGGGAGEGNAQAAAAAQVSGVVDLDPALRSQVSPEDAVFVFAKAPQGSPQAPSMPLAVLRARVKDLPLRFTLDDSMAPTPMARLSDHREVVVAARISRSGQALPASGDLEGSTVAQVGGEAVRVLIDRRRP